MSWSGIDPKDHGLENGCLPNMKNKNESVAGPCEGFLKRAGLGQRMNPEKFWDRLERRFGTVARDVGDLVHLRAEGHTDQEFYRLKNQSFELSLWLSAQFMGDFYRKYMPWFGGTVANRPVARVLDIGCDNGVLTCFYANCFPTAQVVGIDQCAEAIASAQELARRMGIGNVSFASRDALNLSEYFGNMAFDLITATMTYNSLFEIPAMPLGWSLSQLDLPDASKWTAPLGHVSRLLGTNAKFVSVERLTSAAGYLWWAGALRDAGLQVDWTASEILCDTIPEEASRLPVFVCAREQPKSPDLASDILAFHARPELIALGKAPFEGTVAEAVIAAFPDLTLIWGVKVAFADGLIERFEVWDARTLIQIGRASCRERV